jgi:N6-adenosine-specific RNA methylase IME4
LSRYACIVADPPWDLTLSGTRRRVKGGGHGAQKLDYQTMTIDEICALQVASIALPETHLWLWTTNQHLEDGFRVMRAWGFKYLAPIHWIKASGQGNWFVHRTQTLLFGYRERCVFPLARYLPNIIESPKPELHSAKPGASFAYIEAVSPEPRIELFARRNRLGWDAWGNECLSVDLPLVPTEFEKAVEAALTDMQKLSQALATVDGLKAKEHSA